MDEKLAPPPGWRFAAYPWFARDDAPDLPKLTKFGTVLLPEFFHLVIGTEDAWYADRRSGLEYVDGGGECALFLDFQVFEGKVTMPHAQSAFGDLPDTMERVRKVVPLSRWKRLGIHYMVQYLAQFMDEGRQPDGDSSVRPYWYEDQDPYGNQPRAALEWIERLENHASEAYAQAREMPPPRRKRVRITDDHLREVAHVYTLAENTGMPPTRDVANHFRAPHSTAAKWVASARRKKFLPPAGTPSEHAMPDEEKTPEERRTELQWWLKDKGAALTSDQRKAYQEELEGLAAHGQDAE